MAKKRYFSPSELHRRLTDAATQSMGFEQAGKDLNAWQRKLRAKLRRMTGLDNMLAAPRCELNVSTLWSRETEHGRIEKIVFTAEPYADVLAFVCTPKGAVGKIPWFICLQGHSGGDHNSIGVERDDNTKPITVAGDRDFAIGCMKRGIGAISIEQRSFGLRREQTQAHVAGENGCHDATMHTLALGRTLLAERVFDVDRAIDYLHTRDDVDRKQIGVMGNSGGGTVSLFSAAMLKPGRLNLAMPSCYFCTFRDSIMNIYHCMDNYIPGIVHVAEMADILGLFAPHPVVIVAGKQDPIFPIAATRREFKRLQKIYAAAGAPENCKLVVGPEGHRFYAEPAWKAMMKFIK